MIDYNMSPRLIILDAVIENFCNAQESVNDDWVVDVSGRFNFVVRTKSFVLLHDVLADVNFDGFLLKEIDSGEEIFL